MRLFDLVYCAIWKLTIGFIKHEVAKIFECHECLVAEILQTTWCCNQNMTAALKKCKNKHEKTAQNVFIVPMILFLCLNYSQCPMFKFEMKCQCMCVARFDVYLR